jgi:hypothetical protein
MKGRVDRDVDAMRRRGWIWNLLDPAAKKFLLLGKGGKCCQVMSGLATSCQKYCQTK